MLDYIYVNGDSHTAAAEAVNSAAFAEDDGYPELGRRPHPANLAVSWGRQLANQLNLDMICDAESAASNTRILRTAQSWVRSLPPWKSGLVVIQWSTWEREEWWHDNQAYQVGASGLDWLPRELQDRYRQFVSTVDWTACQRHWHERIWQFHQELLQLNIPHLFFNGNNSFDRIKTQHDWKHCYLDPYGTLTYDHALKSSGFATVNPKSWHFGPDAHRFWADFVLEYLYQHSIIERNEIPSD